MRIARLRCRIAESTQAHHVAAAQAKVAESVLGFGFMQHTGLLIAILVREQIGGRLWL